MADQKQLFWLHIKKSAGTTVRSLLRPYYVEVERLNMPETFIQARPEAYNDILNNYRVPLGEYQFKRCLFAREFLYSGQWDKLFSFAFTREPADRCVSMFHYLFWEETGQARNMTRYFRQFVNRNKMVYSSSYAFDLFLETVQEARSNGFVYQQIANDFPAHVTRNVFTAQVASSVFTTHVADVWDDITDLEGKVIISRMYRLESLTEGINDAFEACGIPKRLEQRSKPLNANTRRRVYRPNARQKALIEKIYEKDYEVYESAWHG